MAVNILIFTGMASDIWFRPIGAYRIATELRNQGYTVQVVDLFPLIVNHKRGLFKKFIETFVGPETLWVGFSSTFFYSLQKMKEAPGKGDGKRQLETQSGLPEDEDLPELRQTIMDRNPNCKLVMGGGKAPMRGTNIIDIYVEGYADTSVIKMTKYLEGKNPFFQFRKNEDNSISVVDDPKASHFDFVNSSTVWHPSDHIFPGEALPIEISRGCIFNCSFCAYPLNGKKKLDYMRDTGLLREEFQRNYDLYGTTEYVFMDDTHNDSVDKLEQLYDEVYSRLKFKVRFTTYLRLDLLAAKPHTIDLLHASGLRGAFFGIESLNYQSSKTIGKGLRPERAVETLHKVREVWGNDVATGVSFIVGLPHDTEETVNKWLTQATDVNFPNDSITIFPLYMPYVANDRRLWKSDIESNPEKYGYSYPEPLQYPGLWENKITGLNAKRAQEIAEHYLAAATKNNKKKPSHFIIPGLLNLGYKYEDIILGVGVNPPVLDDLGKDHNSRTAPMMAEQHQRRVKYNTEYINKVLYSGVYSNLHTPNKPL